MPLVKEIKWVVAILVLAMTSALIGFATVLVTSSTAAAFAGGIAYFISFALALGAFRSHGLMLGRVGRQIRVLERSAENAISKIKYGNELNHLTHSGSRATLKSLKELETKTDLLSEKFAQRPNAQVPVNEAVKSDVERASADREVYARRIAAATPARTPRVKKRNVAVLKDQPAPIAPASVDSWVAARQSGMTYCDRSFPYRRPALPRPGDVRVAMIADEFTFNSFKREFDVKRLHPARWRDQMDEHKPAFFFCESAWEGGLPGKGAWRGKIYASVRWPEENRKTLLEILAYCNENGIPTVFWNKEDPAHFDDRINDFVRTAVLFDHVLTTADECIDGYTKQAGALDVGSMMFAVQPSIFNPLGRTGAFDSAVFAGSWYRNYPGRCHAAGLMIDSVLASGRDIVIYDRNFGSKEPRYQYPAQYRDFIRPAVPYLETARIYKDHGFGLTLNSVTNSRTMFARRAFEMAVSGQVVISNSALGVEQVFGDSVIYLDKDKEALHDLTPQDFKRMQHQSLRASLNHTYTHRAEQLLRVVGIDYEPVTDRIDAVAYASSYSEFRAYIDAFKASTKFSHITIVLVGNMEPVDILQCFENQCTRIAVVLERSVHEGLRTQNYLKSQYFAVLRGPDDLFSFDTSYLIGCMQFGEPVLHIAESDSSRFRANRVASPLGCIAAAGEASRILTMTQDVRVVDV